MSTIRITAPARQLGCASYPLRLNAPAPEGSALEVLLLFVGTLLIGARVALLLL